MFEDFEWREGLIEAELPCVICGGKTVQLGRWQTALFEDSEDMELYNMFECEGCGAQTIYRRWRVSLPDEPLHQRHPSAGDN